MEDDDHKAKRRELHDDDRGLKHGVPQGVADEESKGLPHSDRQQTESHPIHRSSDS